MKSWYQVIGLQMMTNTNGPRKSTLSKSSATRVTFLILALLMSSCATSPQILDNPVSVSGSIKHWSTNHAIENAEVSYYWLGYGFPKGKKVLLSKSRSNSVGVFETTLTIGPVKQIRVWTADHLYSGSIYVSGNDPIESHIVEVTPTLGVSFSGRKSADNKLIERYMNIARRIVSGHVPGTPPLIDSLDSLVKSKTITEEERRFLIDNQYRFTGPRSTIDSDEVLYRIYWAGREMEYLNPSDKIKFLTFTERKSRDKKALFTK